MKIILKNEFQTFDFKIDEEDLKKLIDEGIIQKIIKIKKTKRMKMERKSKIEELRNNILDNVRVGDELGVDSYIKELIDFLI